MSPRESISDIRESTKELAKTPSFFWNEWLVGGWSRLAACAGEECPQLAIGRHHHLLFVDGAEMHGELIFEIA